MSVKSVVAVLAALNLDHFVVASDDYNSWDGRDSRDSRDGRDNDGDYRVCPGLLRGTPYENRDDSIPDEYKYNLALQSLDIEAVFEDIYDVMLDSQDCFPADRFNGEESYAGLFLRLAWHASGTFRDTDMAGGSAGGRQRYQPECSWDDNVNLDKARALLAPIKEAYGDALSWGDLFVFAGNAAILYGDGPMNQVCAGRVDDKDGRNSDALNDASPCDPQGNCQRPLGSSTVGLIYVNPEGFLGQPNPWATAPHIRDIFGRMGMNDYETVALIGGGHAFGKCHGPCPYGPGPGPDVQPFNPWPGACGSNFPQDVYTSGFEGAWTSYPLQWDNEYFQLLAEHAKGAIYDLQTGPGRKYEWQHKTKDLIMLTADIALVSDRSYRSIVEEFADASNGKLDYYFAAAWKKLTESGGKFAENKKCVDADTLKPKRGDDSDDDDDDDDNDDDNDDGDDGDDGDDDDDKQCMCPCSCDNSNTYAGWD